MGVSCMQARYIVRTEVVLPDTMTVAAAHDISLELQLRLSSQTFDFDVVYNGVQARYIVEMEVVLPDTMTVAAAHDISLELQLGVSIPSQTITVSIPCTMVCRRATLWRWRSSFLTP